MNLPSSCPQKNETALTSRWGPGRLNRAAASTFRLFPVAQCDVEVWCTAIAWRDWFYCAGIALAIALITAWGLSSCRGYAQEPHKGKVPGLDKITSGPSRLAFSGNVQSLDEKREMLNVNTVQGGNTEVFPVKKGVRVSAANGSKLKLEALKPGTSVIVYYEQKGEKRAVKEIIVLSSGAGREKNKPAPPS